MLENVDSLLKTGGAAAFLALTLLQCVKVWRDLPELKKKNQTQTIQKGLIMHRLRLPMTFLAISAGLFTWSFASTPENGGGEPTVEPCEKIVIAMPPFLNQSGKTHDVESGHKDGGKVDQYSTLSAKRFRRKLSKAIRRSTASQCFTMATDRQIEDTLKQLDQGYSERFDENTQLEIGRLLQAGIVVRGTIESFDLNWWHEGKEDASKTFKIRISIEFVHPETGTEVIAFEYAGKKPYSTGGLSTSDKEGFSQALDSAISKAFGAKEMDEIIQLLNRSR